jgi:hypothetical protein
MPLEKHEAYWTCEENTLVGPLYYFAPKNATKPPYLKQRRVTAILDIAEDGTLAGIKLVPLTGGSLPPPPKRS